jgi:hypothetical protein
MAYKVFLAPTGSGNTVFEGDVINGYTSPDGQKVVVKFYSNDRGYTCGSFAVNAAGAQALRDELAQTLEANSARSGVFHTASSAKHFTLAREIDGAPLILGVIGTDATFGSSYHRGDAAALQKVVAEFDQVLKTIADVVAGKGPAA